MNIDALLLAAEFLERKDRAETDHGYASTLPRSIPGASLSSSFSSSSSSSSSPLSLSPSSRVDRRRASKLKHTQGIRSSHNELEKNRRAHMKQCLELLKSVVPLSGDVTKHTTLGLLNSATALINMLQDAEQVHKRTRDQLLREQQLLRLQYQQLKKSAGPAVSKQQQLLQDEQRFRALIGQYRVRPSVSESSESSVASNESSEYEHEIDVIGSDEDYSDSLGNDLYHILTSQNNLTIHNL